MSQNFLLQFPRAQSCKTQRYFICTHLNQKEINSKKLNPNIWKISKQQIFGILDMVQTLNYWIDMAVKIGSEVHIPLRMEKNFWQIFGPHICVCSASICAWFFRPIPVNTQHDYASHNLNRCLQTYILSRNLLFLPFFWQFIGVEDKEYQNQLAM